MRRAAFCLTVALSSVGLSVLGAAPAAAEVPVPDTTSHFFPSAQPTGRTESSTEQYWQNGYESASASVIRYDSRSRPVLRVSVVRDGVKELNRAEELLEYDSAGRLVREHQVVVGIDPARPDTRLVETTYDSSGFAVKKVETVDYGMDGTDETVTYLFSPDRQGRTISWSAASDDGDGDGQPDESTTVATTYDGRGRVVKDVRTTLANGQPVRVSTYEVTLDGSGRPARTVATETDGAGVLLSRSVVATTYDKRGNATRSDAALDDDGDGAIDQSSYLFTSFSADLPTNAVEFTQGARPTRSETWWTYDKKGRLLRAWSETDDAADGDVDTVTDLTNTYDGSGRPATAVSVVDRVGDAVIDHRTAIRWTYDAKGRVATVTTEVNGPVGGDQLQQVLYSYPSRTTTVITTSIDWDDDGSEDVRYVLTRTTS